MLLKLALKNALKIGQYSSLKAKVNLYCIYCIYFSAGLSFRLSFSLVIHYTDFLVNVIMCKPRVSHGCTRRPLFVLICRALSGRTTLSR